MSNGLLLLGVVRTITMRAICRTFLFQTFLEKGGVFSNWNFYRLSFIDDPPNFSNFVV